MKVLQLIFSFYLLNQACATPSYSTDSSELQEMQKMTFDIGYGRETFDAYVQPNITTFSRGELDHVQKMKHNGHAVKFFNMSPNIVKFYWDGGNGRLVHMGSTKPFSISGTASFPGHKFFFAKQNYNEGSNAGILKRFVVDGDGNMSTSYYYDPFTVPGNEEATNANLMTLTLEELEKFNIMKRNRLFNEHYKKLTGRDYLSMYPRQKPKYFMWPADYFGQQHWFTTKETHFKSIPPAKKVQKITKIGAERVLKEDEVSAFLISLLLLN